MLLQLSAAVLTLASHCDSPPALICCGADQVFIVQPPAKGTVEPVAPRVVWSWRAVDSPQIPEKMQAAFRSTDECKPCGDTVLITSSSGGVALVRRSDKRCLFYTRAKNAHSACRLPEKRIAVAASHGADELRAYEIEAPNREAKPVATFALPGAHGAVWDSERKRMWALGTHVLVLVELRGTGADTELIVEREFPLPSPGGHDLSPMRNRRYLFVTSNTHVYRFDKVDGTFEGDADLINQPRVKSVTQHPRSGEIVYQQATPGQWWSDTIRFVGNREPLRLPGKRLYKVRWDFEPPSQADGAGR